LAHCRGNVTWCWQQLRVVIHQHCGCLLQSNACSGHHTPSVAQTLLAKICRTIYIFIPPVNVSFRGKTMFAGIYFSFFRCEFSVLGRPIATKFCSVIGSVFDFILSWCLQLKC